MKLKEKILAWSIMFLFLITIAIAGWQNYEGEWEAIMLEEAVDMALEKCNNNGMNATECINNLIKDEVQEPYLKFIMADAQSELSRIFNTKNYTLILEANQTLSQIG